METLEVEGVGVAVWGSLAGFATDGDQIEPTIPSTGTSSCGLGDRCQGEELEESGHKEFQTGNRPSLGTDPN